MTPAMKRRERKCQQCGGVFYPRTYQLANGGGKYCSQRCNGDSRVGTPLTAEHRKKVSNGLKGRPGMCGEDNPNYRGGRWVDAKGYVWLSIKGRSVQEHRHLMEAHLGRSLTSDECVHHINENPGDNRIENLQVMSHVEHLIVHKSTLTPEDVICIRESTEKVWQLSEQYNVSKATIYRIKRRDVWKHI